MEKNPAKRDAWLAEDTQDGGSSSGSTGSKLDPSRGGRVVEPGRDTQPQPEAVVVDEDGGGETDPGPKAGRTGKVTDPGRD